MSRIVVWWQQRRETDVAQVESALCDVGCAVCSVRMYEAVQCGGSIARAKLAAVLPWYVCVCVCSSVCRQQQQQYTAVQVRLCWCRVVSCCCVTIKCCLNDYIARLFRPLVARTLHPSFSQRGNGVISNV